MMVNMMREIIVTIAAAVMALFVLIGWIWVAQLLRSYDRVYEDLLQALVENGRLRLALLEEKRKHKKEEKEG